MDCTRILYSQAISVLILFPYHSAHYANTNLEYIQCVAYTLNDKNTFTNSIAFYKKATFCLVNKIDKYDWRCESSKILLI